MDFRFNSLQNPAILQLDVHPFKFNGAAALYSRISIIVVHFLLTLIVSVQPEMKDKEKLPCDQAAIHRAASKRVKERSEKAMVSYLEDVGETKRKEIVSVVEGHAASDIVKYAKDHEMDGPG